MLRRGLKPFDPAKHARFKTGDEYGWAWPPVSYPLDRTGGLAAFGMDGNGPDPTLTVNGGQPVGDCGVAAYAHTRMTTAAICGEDVAANTMTSNDVVTLYAIYSAIAAGSSWRPEGTDWVMPAELDQGVDLGDWLLYLFQQKLIPGFVKLDLSTVDEALTAGFAVILGVVLNTQADNQFGNGQPWDVGPGDQPDPNEGHAIQYLGAASPSGPFQAGTWGAIQPFTLAWKQACLQQAFALVTPEQAAAAAFPFDALVADLHALGGTAEPTPAPTPEPTPPAPPAPVDPPAPTPAWPPGFIEQVEEIGHKAWAEIVAALKAL